MMNFFSSPFDELVEKATSENHTTEDWGQIIEICDRVSVEQNGPKECLKSIYRRLNSPIPVVVKQALVLIDACVNNCGKPFHLEVASREFENNFVKLIKPKNNLNSPIVEKSKELLEKWAKEFKNDPQLSLIPELYARLRREGVDFSNLPSKRKSTINEAALKNPDAVSSAQEEQDIIRAIELSMKDVKINSGSERSSGNDNKKSSNSGTTSSIYPSMSKNEISYSGSNTTNNNTKNNQANTVKEFKVRTLYDFEALEDNELTFKAGEIILVSDKSDPNWWKGSNHRGEGLFPSNFVSTDLNAQPDSPTKDKKVQFKDDVNVVGDQQASASGDRSKGFPKVTEIDESRMDRLLYLLHEADPHSEKADSDELLCLEEQCVNMIPLIDRGIEIIDKEHAELSQLNDKLNSAFTLYHDLMKEAMEMEKCAPVGYSTGYAPNYGPMVQNQYVMPPPPGSQYNGAQYTQYAPVPNANFYPGSNIQSQPYSVQGSVQLSSGQQQQQQPTQQQTMQTVIPQMNISQQQIHQQSQPQQQQPQSQHPQQPPPYGQNGYPAQSIASNVSQTIQDGSLPSGSMVNLL